MKINWSVLSIESDFSPVSVTMGTISVLPKGHKNSFTCDNLQVGNYPAGQNNKKEHHYLDIYIIINTSFYWYALLLGR